MDMATALAELGVTEASINARMLACVAHVLSPAACFILDV